MTEHPLETAYQRGVTVGMCAVGVLNSLLTMAASAFLGDPVWAVLGFLLAVGGVATVRSAQRAQRRAMLEDAR